MTEAEKDLLNYLTSWLEWTRNGAPDGKPYDRGVGLCGNVSYFVIKMKFFAHLKDTQRASDLRKELDKALIRDFRDPQYPFMTERQYDLLSIELLHHENPTRLEWVRKYIEENDDD